jgi:hypothetical protein
VSIDGKRVGTTPMSDKLELPAGPHTLTFEHDSFVPVETLIVVDDNQQQPQLVRVDFCAQHVAVKPGKVNECK